MTHRITISLVLLTAALAPVAAAQPQDAPQQRQRDRRPGTRGVESDQARERVRDMLGRRLQAMRFQQERLEQAMRMLEEGEPLEAIRQHMESDENRPPQDEPRSEPGEMFRGDPDDRPRGERPEGEFHGGPDGDFRGEPGGGPDEERRDLSPEEMRGAIEMLRETDPKMHNRLRRLMKQRPAEARRVLRRFRPRLREMMELRQRHPEAFRNRIKSMRIERRVMETADAYARASKQGEPDDKLQQIRAQLHDSVADMLDLRLEKQTLDVHEAMQRLEKIQANVTELATASRRNELIERRVNDLIERALARHARGARRGPDRREP